MKCRCCDSNNLSKYGFNNKNIQRYICKDCNSITLEKASHNWLTKQEKEWILKLVKEGNSIRSISRIVNKKFKGVYDFIKKN